MREPHGDSVRTEYTTDVGVLQPDGPMQAVLVEKNSNMRTLWLPRTKEGRYRFGEGRDGSEIPISIVAEKQSWYAVCGKQAVFLINGEPIGRRILLRDQFRIEVQYLDIKYILYTYVIRPLDHVFVPYYVEQHQDITIGRSQDRDIFYPNKLVSREHAILHWENGHWNIMDTESKNGVYLNGTHVTAAALSVGDVIYIMGLYIIIGAGFISMNNANGRVQLMTQKVRPLDLTHQSFYAHVAPGSDDGWFDRQPRRRNMMSADPIEIEMPPMPMNGSRMPLMLRMGNPMLMGGRALFTGNIFSAITSMLMPMLTQGFTEKDRKEYEGKRTVKYREYLVKKNEEIQAELQRESVILNRNYPVVTEVLNFADKKERLWERQKDNEDFLSVRIGSGNTPMVAEKQYRPRRFELEEDPLVDEMYALAEKPSVLTDAPIMLSLRKDYLCGILGRTETAVTLARDMIIQLSLTHSYDEVKIVLLADAESAAQLDFLRYLPHNWDNDRTIRFFATSRSDAQKVSEYLTKAYSSEKGSSLNAILRQNPAYVVFALNKELFDAVEVFKEITGREEYCGFSLVMGFDGVPKECQKLLDVREGKRIIDLAAPENEDQLFRQDFCSPHQFMPAMKTLMHTKLKLGAQQFSLPNMMTFLEMYGVGMVEHLNPLKRWEDNNPVKSLAVPVGIGTDGSLFSLDLHEKRQGPHGLVAGMTGSGKSEFLITYILSMAVNFNPDEVAFILIDYKGGGLADAFVDESKGIHLPHVVGTITNLDGASIQRSLLSINSELKRRQAVFKRAKSETNEGTMDIYDYQKLYRNKKVSEPMPHLFIISDEFAELKKQQPEFMNELISTARIGRSLGVHLILATQKPGGVVNDQIWSNTKFRVCLRVQDRSDSQEMLKRPEAAELKNTGRFYLQVGYNELFALGQSAWCGADYNPQEEVLTEADHSVQFVDNTGQTMLNVKPKAAVNRSGLKQIVAIVRYLSDLAKREGITPRKLWSEPLPKKLELIDLIKQNPPEQNGHISAVLGMADDPERQAQFPLILDLQSFRHMLLGGNSSSGKSSFIRTLLFSLIARYSPEDVNYYILDMSSGALSAFADMPHCGAYVTEERESDFDRMVDLMHDLVRERRALFAEAQVSSFDAYRLVEKMPLVLFIIDGFTNITTFKRGTEYYNTLHELMRETASYGIRIILTANHVNEVGPRSKQELDYRITLHSKDRFEYADFLNIKAPPEPPDLPGRGLCIVDGRTLEYQAAIPFAGEEEQIQAQKLRQLLNSLAGQYTGSAVKLPMLEEGKTMEEFLAGEKPGSFPLGFSRKDMKKIMIPLQQLHSMSLFFGNPAGAFPVWHSILLGAELNEMDLIIMHGDSDSLFLPGAQRDIFSGFRGKRTLVPCSAEGLASFIEMITQELIDRNRFRDQYCEMHGIPRTDKSRAKKAGKFIRQNSRSILVIFESFADLCRLQKTQEDIENLSQFFQRTKGYNIYFAAGFRPEDNDSIPGNQLLKKFNPDQLVLHFGGRYDKSPLGPLPSDLRRMESMNPLYDRYMLKYRDEYYSMVMPCGPLESGTEDPDEASIL